MGAVFESFWFLPVWKPLPNNLCGFTWRIPNQDNKTTIHYALIAVYSRIAAPEGLCQLNKIRFILLNLGDMVTMLLWYQLPGDAETDTPKGDLNGSFWGGKKYMGMAYKKCGFYMHAEG